MGGALGGAWGCMVGGLACLGGPKYRCVLIISISFPFSIKFFFSNSYFIMALSHACMAVLIGC